MSRIGTFADDDLAGWVLKSPELGQRDRRVRQRGLQQEPVADADPRTRRTVIAHSNECEVCVNTRDADGPANGVDEELYDHADQWRTWPGYSDQERVAAEFAYRFATEHTVLRDDEDFWTRANEHFSEELLADLALSCALWIGMGRVLRTLDIAQSCQLTLPSRV